MAKTYRFTISCENYSQILRLKEYFQAEERRISYIRAAKKLFNEEVDPEDPEAEKASEDPNFLKFKGFGPEPKDPKK